MIVIYNPRVVPDEKIVFFANVAFKSVICLYLIGHRSFKLNQKRTTLFFHSKRNQRFSFVQNCWSLDSLDRERRISFNLVPSSNGKSGYLHFKVKPENTHRRGMDLHTAGLQFNWKIRRYLHVVKELNIITLNWRPAVCWSLPLRSVFSSQTMEFFGRRRWTTGLAQ